MSGSAHAVGEVLDTPVGPAGLPVGPHVRTPGTFYHPELDVVRFCAFLLVFIAHSSTVEVSVSALAPGIPSIIASAFWGAGFSGLTLFFTLSSYLITELLLQEQDRTGAVHLRAFYLRRLVRIWPLYFFFLLIVRPLVAHYIPWEHFPLSAYLAFSLLLGNWFCFYKGFPPSVATPLWSISIEEQFYLFWPLLVSRFRRHVPVIAVCMLVAANLSRAILVLYPRPDPALWCGTLTRLDPFALGALVAFYTHGRELRMDRVMRLLLVSTSILLLLFLGRSGAHNGDMALLFYPLESIGCCLALFATLRPMTSWRPGPLGRVLIYLGRISYGLYVYHLMMLVLISRIRSLSFVEHEVLAMLGCIGLASASYAWLEAPFLKLKHRFTFVPSRP